MQRVDTTLSKRILDKCNDNGGFPVPPNLAESRFLQFAADNIDIIKDALDGKGTFHATQMVAFQRGKADQGGQLPLGKESSLQIPVELQQLHNAPEVIGRPQPRFPLDVDLESYKPDPVLILTSD